MRNWGVWLKAALVRALKTFAQTAVASITVGAALEEVAWLHVLSVAGLSFVLSMLTSLAGLPEVDQVQPVVTDPPDEVQEELDHLFYDN